MNRKAGNTNMATKPLQDIATIKSGVFVKPGGDGEVVYLQANDLNDDGILNKTLFPSLTLDEKISKHLIQPGDILFARSSKIIATTFTLSTLAVCSTSFFIIRLREPESILPEYVTWFINSPSTQQVLRGQAAGTSDMISISKKAIEAIEIAVPDIEKQLAILKISALRLKEKSLKAQIEDLKERQIQHYLENYLKAS